VVLVADSGALGETATESSGEQERQALRESEERYRIVTEISRDAIEVVNEKGTTIYVNPAMEDVLGFTREECLDKPIEEWWDIVHPDDRDRVAEEYDRVVNKHETVYYAPMRCRRKDGRWIWIKAIATSYLSASGERCVLEVTRDITEEVEAEQHRHETAAKAKEARRLESLGLLAGGIAHDFNNILVAVLGYADLALHELSASSPARQMIKNVMKGGQRAADLCSQMLAYSGKRQLGVGAIALSEVVNEMSQLLEASVSKQAVLEYELAATLPAIEADATQLRRVVMNLIVNASEAIGNKSGVISVSTGTTECDSDDLSKAFFVGEKIFEGVYVYLQVSDTGCGMDEETKEKIFDPFFTTKFTGRGLGLATVLGIARAHNGAIELESEPGKGTIIRVLIPAVEQPAEALVRETPDPAAWRGSGTVLVVDDEEPVRAVASMMLENAGFNVRAAADGLEALEIFRKHQGDVVCVVLDLTMPNMDGEETLGELRRIQEDVKVILSSGYHEDDLRERLVEVGFAGFVKKPYTSEALIEQLRQILEEDGTA
jgi:PAS domain S-box-containing protein